MSADGAGWVSLPGNVTSTAGAGMYGITGTSKGWVSASYGLAAYAGQQVYLRFRYFTDGGVAQKGWMIDDIAVSGGAFFDGAGSAAQFVAEPADGWSIIDGSKTKTATRYYIGDYRTRQGFDGALANCYDFADYAAGRIEYFAYNTGLLGQYRNTQYGDNDTVYHLGEGGWSYVDSHPVPDYYKVSKTKKKSLADAGADA